MPEAPRVSVIVPTWQRRELVKRAVASALAQTHRDLELIVVDDGSTDGTRDALTGVDERIRYLWQENAGPSAARNAALGIARGEYVAFLDSDDLWLPEHLEITIEALERNPEAVLVTTCPGRAAVGRQLAEDADLVDPLPRLFAEHFVGWLHCLLVRRAALDAIGGFDERIRAGEHHDLFLRLALHGPFLTMRRRTAVRRAAPNSLHEDARGNGDYVTGFETTARTVARAVEAGRRPELAAAAQARVEFARALRGLHDGDDAAAGAALRRACELFPRFSDEPEWVDARIRFTTGTPARAERMRKLAAAAELWPEPGADTARYLRGHAIGVAVRTGRPGRAAALVRGWPIRGSRGFARRAAPRLRKRAREWVYGKRHLVRRTAP